MGVSASTYVKWKLFFFCHENFIRIILSGIMDFLFIMRSGFYAISAMKLIIASALKKTKTNEQIETVNMKL